MTLARVRLIEERDQASLSQLDVVDHIAASRDGQMIRPYAAILHRPELGYYSMMAVFMMACDAC